MNSAEAWDRLAAVTYKMPRPPRKPKRKPRPRLMNSPTKQLARELGCHYYTADYRVKHWPPERWHDPIQQQNAIEWGGRQWTLLQLAVHLRINECTLKKRIYVSKWPPERWGEPSGAQGVKVAIRERPATDRFPAHPEGRI